MRALAALVLLAPLAVAQQSGAPPAATPTPTPAPAAPQLTPPSPLPGDPLPDGAEWTTTASGLRYVVLAKGDETKDRPGRTDRVAVYYAGYLENGKKVDSCLKPAQPAEFVLNQVAMKGWAEGVRLMHPGAKFKLHIPASLAYGEMGRLPAVPTKSNLIFDIELVSFVPDPSPRFSMPEDKDLTTTASGLKYIVLKPGNPDGKKPVATDTVTVHYIGWLTDGTSFDSSYARGTPSTVSLKQVIKGWAEGLQLMQEGEICKFVIPASLGWGDRGRAPIPGGATIVFQLELIKVGK